MRVESTRDEDRCIGNTTQRPRACEDRASPRLWLVVADVQRDSWRQVPFRRLSTKLRAPAKGRNGDDLMPNRSDGGAFFSSISDDNGLISGPTVS